MSGVGPMEVVLERSAWLKASTWCLERLVGRADVREPVERWQGGGCLLSLCARACALGSVGQRNILPGDLKTSRRYLWIMSSFVPPLPLSPPSPC